MANTRIMAIAILGLVSALPPAATATKESSASLAIIKAVYRLSFDAEHQRLTSRAALAVRNVSRHPSNYVALEFSDSEEFSATLLAVKSDAVSSWRTESGASDNGQVIYLHLKRPLAPRQTLGLELVFHVTPLSPETTGKEMGTNATSGETHTLVIEQPPSGTRCPHSRLAEM